MQAGQVVMQPGPSGMLGSSQPQMYAQPMQQYSQNMQMQMPMMQQQMPMMQQQVALCKPAARSDLDS